MKVRTTIAGTLLSARLTAAGLGALTVLGSVALSACSGSSGTTTPAIFSPSVTGSATAGATASNTASSGATSSADASPSVPDTASPTVTASGTKAASAKPSPSPTPRRSATSYPTAAPPTGGGGTAGVQDVLLFGLGGAAILVGAGSVVYRRKLTRGR